MTNLNSTSPSLISIWAVLLPSVLYFIHWFLVESFKGKPPWKCENSLLRGVTSERGLKYIWNLILLLLFIPGGIFGLLLGFGIKTPFLVYWHYQGGAAMVIISFIHVLNHLNYYFQAWRTLK